LAASRNATVSSCEYVDMSSHRKPLGKWTKSKSRQEPGICVFEARLSSEPVDPPDHEDASGTNAVQLRN
jgi:hypothetical protein